jgi:hypothetical protein
MSLPEAHRPRASSQYGLSTKPAVSPTQGVKVGSGEGFFGDQNDRGHRPEVASSADVSFRADEALGLALKWLRPRPARRKPNSESRQNNDLAAFRMMSNMCLLRTPILQINQSTALYRRYESVKGVHMPPAQTAALIISRRNTRRRFAQRMEQSFRSCAWLQLRSQPIDSLCH